MLPNPRRYPPSLSHVLLLLLSLVAAVPLPALADDNQQVIRRISIQQLHDLMKAEGYGVRIDEDGDLEWKIDGYRTYMLVADDSESVQFRVGFNDGTATLEKVNDWNSNKRYSTSYLDKEGDPVLELDLDLAGGVTKARMLDYLTTCRVSFEAWVDEVVN